ncbi:uncharacterized protein LOC142537187 [Primulina tabacum]|uniref:uncharacterized protein LOC142537187 n=1 Tax=Primulina tabacum TaxID=48773 RepID=UPI003F59F8CE
MSFRGWRVIKGYAPDGGFSDVLTDCGLFDIQARGDPFTWCNQRLGDENIVARLDRFVCSSEWQSQFPTAEVEHLAYCGSYHRPIYLTFKSGPLQNLRKCPKRFTFEHKWLLEEDFTDTFSRSWQALKEIKDNIIYIREIEYQIEKLSEQEEIHWNQRARVNWLQHGDRNTKFFRATASQRRRNNFIKGLMNDRGIGALMFKEKVRRAVFDMHPSKAPGPDGFTALFYHKLWPIVGEDVTKEVLAILNDQAGMTDWNETLITLIPKIKDPVSLKDFRPIRRLILDNVIVGFECMHWIRNNQKAKSGIAALKLDMSKAYDRVEWIFLQKMMLKMGFAEHWVNLIMRCVTSVSYSVRLNNSIYGTICPSRGLRQGDPLSPYLFVLCAQGFSHIFTKAVELKLFRGVKVVNSCPVISHLFFADDSLIFFRATKEDSVNVRRCIQIYEKASGQMVNFDKSSLTFSPSTSAQQSQEIADVLSVSIVNGHDIYLGLPTLSLRNKRLQFGFLRERMENKIRSWSTKFFSMGGKEILIKSVLQAIPSYIMSCFRIPDNLCKELEQLCAKFWWRGNNDMRGMHWLKWDSLCNPKSMDGLGYRRLSAFNKALVAKQIWRIIQRPHSLLTRFLKARYFKDTDIMMAGLGNNPSYVWRSLLWSRELIRKGLCWRVGNGQGILAKQDPWIPTLPSFHCQGNDLLDDNAKVGNFITSSGSWNETLVRQHFPPYEAEDILNVPLNRNGSVDTRFWVGNKSGKYTVKDGYHRERSGLAPHPFQSSHPNQSWWNFLWSLRIQPKIRIFLWRASHDLLPTPVNLALHHIPTEDCALFLLATFKQEDFEYFATLCWAIWHEICKINHETARKKFTINVDWAYAMMENFRKYILVASSGNNDAQIFLEDKWVPPLPDYFRLDVDADFDIRNNKFSVGAVVRNTLGQVCGVQASPIRYPGSVTCAELLTIRSEMDLCLWIGLSNVCIFSDSLEAIRMVFSHVEDLGSAGVLALKIQSMLELPNFHSIKHVRRQTIEVAHILARKALPCNSSINCVNDDIPLWLVNIVSRDFPN